MGHQIVEVIIENGQLKHVDKKSVPFAVNYYGFSLCLGVLVA